MYTSIIYVVVLVATANAIPFLCHCKPGQSCWPTASEWVSLNSTLRGNLFPLVPVASPCHVPNYNAAACAVVTANSPDSKYRAAQPGALQWQNWEAWPEQNQYCYVQSPESVPCGQGRVSLYTAEVETVADIQATVNFSVRYNIKLVIKNTGHNLLGTSSAPNSLQLNTYKLKNISVENDFIPAVPSGTAAPPPVKAVTVGAGVELQALYEYLNTQNIVVVGGSARTVGIAGGYIQGGGHSLMGWIAGMGSDNALEFQVVTAAGALVTANAYQNTDLFFALRGGGGGTYGVVVSATVTAYPNYPVIFTQTNYTLPTANAAFWNGVEALHNYLVSINDAGGTGYYYITPINPALDGSTSATVFLYIWFVNATNTTATLEPLFPPLLAALTNATGSAPAFEAFPFPSMTSMYGTIFTGSDAEGYLVQIGSRLISRSFVNSPNGPAKISAAMQAIGSSFGPQDYFEGAIVSGGQVTRNAGISSGLNPAWRSTLIHLLFTRLWNATTPPAEVTAITKNITNVQVPILKSLEPGKMGAYLNEADANEAGFQQSFWGDNYYRLYGIKSEWDPNGVFITRKSVGSEYWDDDGACHTSSPSTT